MHEFKALEKTLVDGYMRTEVAMTQHEKLQLALEDGVAQINDKIGSDQLDQAVMDL